MKLLITTTALSLLLGAPLYALQSQDKDKDKPAPQDEPRKQDRSEQDKDKDKDRQPDKRQPDRNRPPEPRQDSKARDQEKQDRDRAGQDREQHPAEQPRDNRNDNRNRVQSQNSDRQGVRNSGGRGRRIPDDRFRASFGREHTFHIQRGSGGVRGGGGQRFQYGGYWFEYTEAWPSEWSYDDDFYIDYYDDDYYLYDVRYPSIRIIVIVVD